MSILKKMILRKLEGIQNGRIVLRDGTGTREFGEPADLRSEVEVRDPKFWRRVAFGGSIGAGEAYMDGQWGADDLVALLRILVRNLDRVDGMERGPARVGVAMARLLHRLRRNTRRGSRRNIGVHYDLGNDFYAIFLDPTMTYSCGIFGSPWTSLEDAQVAKLNRVCRKLDLTADDHVLEIGTGWGSFAIHAAGQYGSRVTTTTISREQFDLAQRRVREAGLDDRVDVRLCDYRDIEGRFDKLVSIEMIEAVGHAFYDTYFGTCSRLLAPDGRMCIQAIVMPDHRYPQYLRATDFIQKHVFPGSCLPSLGAISGSLGRATDLRMTGLDDLTPHYATTLRLWRERFLARRDEVRALGYADEFLRMWEFYLAYCEAGFLERTVGDVQILFEKPGCRAVPVLPEIAMEPA